MIYFDLALSVSPIALPISLLIALLLMSLIASEVVALLLLCCLILSRSRTNLASIAPKLTESIFSNVALTTFRDQGLQTR